MAQVSKSMKVIDKLRLDNFNLKKQIAFDKKKYIDLKNAFIELRQQSKLQENEMHGNPEIH